MPYLSKILPHKDCASDMQSDFLSDETKSTVNTLLFTSIFVKYERKLTCRFVRCSLCGFALITY